MYWIATFHGRHPQLVVGCPNITMAYQIANRYADYRQLSLDRVQPTTQLHQYYTNYNRNP